MKIIGITGKSRSGKDTLGEYFTDKGYIKLSFADALKSILAILTGWPEDFIN